MKQKLSMLLGFAALLLIPAAAFASGGVHDGGISDPAVGFDHLWFELMVDLFIIGGIFGAAAIYMLIKYKAKNPEDHGQAPKLTTAQAWGWAMIPAFVFMADDFFLAAKGWSLWNIYRTVPENALEVKVIGSQWSWEFDYGDGVTSDVLKVPAERPVVMRMTSDDVIHSFFLPKHRVKEDMMPGRVTYLWFLPKEGEKSFVTCTEFCGTNHSDMYSDVIAVPENEFYAWLDSEKGIEVADSASEPELVAAVVMADAEPLSEPAGETGTPETAGEQTTPTEGGK